MVSESGGWGKIKKFFIFENVASFSRCIGKHSQVSRNLLIEFEFADYDR